MSFVIVTIDGPAGSGKSTVARQLAQELNFRFLDTGAMYRSVALLCLKQNVDLENRDKVGKLAAEMNIEFLEGDVWLNGENVNDEIRTQDATMVASVVATYQQVRDSLVKKQRLFGQAGHTVTEGRDQGSIVFPQANYKYFLTATPEVRAHRRFEQLTSQGKEANFDEILRSQNERDQRDLMREHSPLKPPDDAQMIDTSNLEIDDVTRMLVEQIRQGISQ